MDLYEISPFNWRLANFYLQTTFRYSRPLISKVARPNEMVLLSEQIEKHGLLNIRDWLYDEDYIRSQWEFVGVFGQKPNKKKYARKNSMMYSMIGMSFSFEDKVDSALFKLMWDADSLNNV